MSRLHIVHTTRYSYNHRVTLSYNEARMTPVTDPQQVVLESVLKVKPSQAGVSSYRDYWGTKVTAFDMQTPHEELEVSAHSTVEVHRPDRSLHEARMVSWSDLASAKTQEAFSDWLPQTRLSTCGVEVEELVREVVGEKDPHSSALAVFEWMRGEMEYVKGITGVHTSAQEAWLERKGVCQDLAHVGIGALRSMNIPARYVSGYIHPQADAEMGQIVSGQSHAWLEWWDGEWRSWDPTNHKAAGDLHVSVARGRDYRDVPPLKGILSGGGGSTLQVTVEVTRLA
ncbi:transglutaminase family protein [Psychromicrobium xiongbiense]|uniref:transglutaminase family protein n=1 Tax=Psychromicrobium xiongbiense TaxID=3051184 RepID=UPI0025566CA5|nr:transglutaminase family protein [Psychromicrobium sp. YIM S02556]